VEILTENIRPDTAERETPRIPPYVEYMIPKKPSPPGRERFSGVRSPVPYGTGRSPVSAVGGPNQDLGPTESGLGMTERAVISSKRDSSSPAKKTAGSSE